MNQLSYRKLHSDIDLNGFTCGVPSIDQLLTEAYYATCLKQGFGYEILIRKHIIGYFFISFTVIDYSQIDDEAFGSSLMNCNFPMIHMKFVAIDHKYQHHYIGREFLKVFISHMRDLSRTLPFRYIVIDALKELYDYYRDIGFEPIDSSDLYNSESTIRMLTDLINDDERAQLDAYIEQSS